MKTKISKPTLLSTVLLGAISLVGQSGAIANPTLESKQAQNQYPSAVVNGYVSACQKKATASGLSASQATKLCRCTIEKFQSRLTIAQFQELNRQARQGNSPAVFTEVGMECYGELSR